MRALGDKIGSTIIAQSAGVPCIRWNGSDIVSQYDRTTGMLPAEDYARANVTSVAAASVAAAQVGFPVMIKASEGGGGKGIRMVDCAENVADAYRQVSGEVPGSPIFIMKLSTGSRHLEVQLIADEYGEALALNGRDCSVQRRHQKIIEEGPPVAASDHVWPQMEKAAVQLAQAVGYANAGTVEYLYSEKDEQFYFLELNPRLQVEHPVTEMITRVNLPATQLQVAMGIPLHNIPEIRELYGHTRFFDEDVKSVHFQKDTRNPPHGHCIAVRITAENAEAGFKPTSGGIQELNFRSTPDVWGYFSMDSSGMVHEFADSQFGHLFANGQDREHARKNMALALKELSIRGDISTNVDYISHLIEMEDFVENRIDTAWLDRLIKADAQRSPASSNNLETEGVERKLRIHPHQVVVIGAAIVGYDKCMDGESQFMESLRKGQFPQKSLLNMTHDVELILDDVKYRLVISRMGEKDFVINAGDSKIKTNVRLLNDGGYLISIGGASEVAYVTSRDPTTGMRMSVGGTSVVFAPDYDPTSLRTDVAGKLVKKLVEDGVHVTKGQPYAEIEVMKMFMPLKVEENGVLTWRENEGAAMDAGSLLATLALDSPEAVRMATVFEGKLEVDDRDISAANHRPHLILRRSLEGLAAGIAGYACDEGEMDRRLDTLTVAASDGTLPVYEINEQLSALAGRIDAALYESLSSALNNFVQTVVSSCDRFPVETVLERLDKHAEDCNPAGRAAFSGLTGPLREAATPYAVSGGGTVGCERVLQSFLGMLRRWYEVERNFAFGINYADAVDRLRTTHRDNLGSVLAICRSHARLSSTVLLVTKIIGVVGRSFDGDVGTVVAGAPSMTEVVPVMTEIGDLGGSDVYADVALTARRLLLQDSQDDAAQRRQRVGEVAKALPSSIAQEGVAKLLEENVPLADLLLSMLQDETAPHAGLLEVYVRSLYRTSALHNLVSTAGSYATWTYSGIRDSKKRLALNSSTPVTSMNDLMTLSRSNSANILESENESEMGTMSFNAVSSSTKRTGVLQVFKTLEEMEAGAQVKLNDFPKIGPGAEPVNVLHILILRGCDSDDNAISKKCADDDGVSKRCHALLRKMHDSMVDKGIRRISFIVGRSSSSDCQLTMPAIFTYRSKDDFGEDCLFRHIEPSEACNLELDRLVKNFNFELANVRLTRNSNVHLYSATPRKSALARDGSRAKNLRPRIFARALSLVADYTVSAFERIFVDALNALDVVDKTAADHHLFINLLSNRHLHLQPSVLENVVETVVRRHAGRIQQLGLVEVETRIVCCLGEVGGEAEEAPPIAIRMVASNPTGFNHVTSTYVEVVDDKKPTERVFRLVGGTKASLAGSGDASWEGLPVSTPYPLTRPFDTQRRAAAVSSDTLYCYDLPALFEAACELQWTKNTENIKGGAGVVRPMLVMFSNELVVQWKSGHGQRKWTMQDYLDGKLEMVQTQRSPGNNEVGMVAWFMTLKTYEYPLGRQIVLISNDITFKAGSFGTREDVVFKMASDYARERRVPRLYVAANSGARIGVADGVRKCFKVAFKDKNKPENGFDYLYVNGDDFDELTKSGAIIADRETDKDGNAVYKLTDIIGTEPDLGVENLKGSGLIAGETSAAYNDIFTMTIVLGRTVGIGAYLVRLGQRTIQKTTASPIILTGYQALNKLMGCDVYTTNDQLGGPGIMFNNGVSHLVATNHLEAISQALNWIAYVPSVRGGILPITDVRAIDVVERPIGFTPKLGIPYDPRMLLAGGENETGEWVSGFFDRGSFTETLAGWARTVIVGRARLGGIPMGVVVTENRTAKAVKPADPADVQAAEAVIQQAGCVWFPNSAYKTAQAIEDFNTEDLPLMVFANWRGFSGGQRDMFDEVLKYGAKIVDAFVNYQQPVFVYIPPYAEIRGGAWVVLDASINSAVMEMYASSKSSRGGVLEANGAASVKYRLRDLLATMHRLDEGLRNLDAALDSVADDVERTQDLRCQIEHREKSLLPVYEQIAVNFCDLHDTPGRMKATGVIEQAVEWKHSREFFFWRLRRKLAEFDLRKKMMKAYNVGRGDSGNDMSALAASALIKKWFIETKGHAPGMWSDDRVMLNWMAIYHNELEVKVSNLQKERIEKEVSSVLVSGGEAGVNGIVDGVVKAMKSMNAEDKEKLLSAMKQALNIC
uniref:Acetyl-CoA carboxylase n=1 Tax=Corethron hystrix TaxID=216773 RepID=A0A7S1BIY5_9STRA